MLLRQFLDGGCPNVLQSSTHALICLQTQAMYDRNGHDLPAIRLTKLLAYTTQWPDSQNPTHIQFWKGRVSFLVPPANLADSAYVARLQHLHIFHLVRYAAECCM